jgi:hypothetical protein
LGNPDLNLLRRWLQPSALFLKRLWGASRPASHGGTRPGKTYKKPLKMAIEIVDLPIKNSDFP